MLVQHFTDTHGQFRREEAPRSCAGQLDRLVGSGALQREAVSLLRGEQRADYIALLEQMGSPSFLINDLRRQAKEDDRREAAEAKLRRKLQGKRGT
jgi:hypothetical protein